MEKQKGFLIISLVLAVCIIAILFVLYFNNNAETGTPSPAQQGKQGIEQTKENNEMLKSQEIEIQNQLNSF
jgi:Tfp pilus assembly major pilin PilA